MIIKETDSGKMLVACKSCAINDLLPFESNPDEVFLEFLVRYDDGQISSCAHLNATNVNASHSTSLNLDSDGRTAMQDATCDKAGLQNPMIRTKSEVDGMIGEESPDRLMRQVLYSKKDYLAEYRVIREPEPEYGQSLQDTDLSVAITDALYDKGIRKFYRFQDMAIKSILAGKDTIIEAPTAAGKTEAFVTPVVQRIINMNKATDDLPSHMHGMRRTYAVFVYPTKALARDQMPKIQDIAEAAGLTVSLVDGDTKSAERSKIASNPPHILVTNFDLIHHQLWRRGSIGRILGSVKMIIIDEVHTYSGIFGSNVHYIIKRLSRIARTAANGGVSDNDDINGNDGKESKGIQIIAASATLDNAVRFCTDLFGLGGYIEHVRGTGPSREIEFAMLFPVLRKPRALMADLTRRFATLGHKTMVFNRSHRGAELLAIYCQRSGVKIRVHRAGLTPEHRIATESQFKDGLLQAVSCTPTLELGIDIGSTDCIVSAPTPINRLVQRMGRAARRKGRHGYAFLALGDDPISQYYKNHPSDYFEDAEIPYIDPSNPYVKECQIIAMAHDMPIKSEEVQAQDVDIINELVVRGVLKRVGSMIVPGRQDSAGAQMLANYSIRGTAESVDIIYRDSKVGDRACPIALDELHKGAVYLLAGRSYMVDEFDYPEKEYAVIEELPHDHPYYTKSLTTEYPTIEEIIEKRTVKGIEAAFCRLLIRKRVTGYVKIGWKYTRSPDDLDQRIARVPTDGKEYENDENDTDEMPSETVELERPLEYRYVTKGIAFCAPYPCSTVEEAASTLMKMQADAFAEYQGQDMRQQQQSPPPLQQQQHNGMPPANRLEEQYITASGYHATEHVVIEGSNMITGGASQDLGGISMGTSGMIFIHDGVTGGSGASRALYDRLEMAFERGASIIGECPCRSESGCPRCIMSYRCGNNNQYLHKMAALEIFKRINSGEQTTLLLDSLKGHKPIV